MATQYSVQELREIIAETIFNADNAKLYLLGQLLAMLKPNVLCNLWYAISFTMHTFYAMYIFLCKAYFYALHSYLKSANSKFL